MPTPTAMPYPLTAADIRPGDRVRATQIASNGTITATEFTVTQSGAVVHGDGLCFPTLASATTFMLLDRLTEHGDAWDAPYGTLWRTPSGHTYCRTHVRHTDDEISSTASDSALLVYVGPDRHLTSEVAPRLLWIKDALVISRLASTPTPSLTPA